MKLSHYIFICFFLITSLMLVNKDTYTIASYNPTTDEIVTYREDVPDYIIAHEEVHRLMWWEGYLIVACGIGTIFGFAIGTEKTKYTYLFYILLSVHSEATAYLLTPVQTWEIIFRVVCILVFGLTNLWFWQYFFFKSSITKSISQFTKRDIIFPPCMVVIFWMV